MNSSVVQNVSSDSRDLFVTFKSGKTYTYFGAANHATKMVMAPSVGRYLRANILGKFEYVAS